MKKLALSILISSSFLLMMDSCKKENTGPSVPAPPHAAGNSTVNAIPLNGGNLLGRWTSFVYYDVTYRNDTFQTETTDTIAAGAEVINFFANGVTTLWLDDTIFIDSGTYVTNANNLTLYFSFDTVSASYGVNGNRLRWHTTEQQMSGPDLMRTESDVVFDRY